MQSSMKRLLGLAAICRRDRRGAGSPVIRSESGFGSVVFKRFLSPEPVFTLLENTIRSHRMRPVWGGCRAWNPKSAAALQITDIDARCDFGSDLARRCELPADGVWTERCSTVHGDGRDGRRGADRS